ncbi:MAG TPA: GNAT family protein, partial [Gemmatimonadaceae bacterium]|nr:GNAT family protein [Gemmatimonadaceae bacterium]
WPPELLDVPALEWVLRWQDNPANQSAFGFYWIVLREAGPPTRVVPARTLVGVFGFKGMPDTDGTVELGYGVVAEFQRRGFATEAVRAMLARAFAHAGVRRVTAETLPGLAPSIGVLEKCGFRFVGSGSEPGVIRYEILRGEDTRLPTAPSEGLSAKVGARMSADPADLRR